MAIVMSRDLLPAVGDVVTEVLVDDDGRTADVHFKSGVWVAVHLTLVDPPGSEIRPLHEDGSLGDDVRGGKTAPPPPPTDEDPGKTVKSG